MFLKWIKFENFRIYDSATIEFSDGLNFIVGGNGQGKTSVLESIYMYCTTKSFRTSSDSELVRFNCDSYSFNGQLLDTVNHNLRIFYSLNESKKTYFKDSKPVHKATEIIGKFPVVLLTPDDHSITAGYSIERRKFVDSVISQSSEMYLNHLLDYNKTLRQRADLLTKIRETGRRELIDQLDAWTEKLVQTGVELINYRRKFINELDPFIKKAYSLISNKKEAPSIYYKTISDDQSDLSRFFTEKLNSLQKAEIAKGANLAGPHKDDFVLYINDKELRTYGSQGQHKTFQVSLRFAQFFYLKEKLGKNPFFLLDDVFGELDTERSVAISDFLREIGQAFITLTDFSNYKFLKRSADDRLISVDKGSFYYG